MREYGSVKIFIVLLGACLCFIAGFDCHNKHFTSYGEQEYSPKRGTCTFQYVTPETAELTCKFDFSKTKQ